MEILGAALVGFIVAFILGFLFRGKKFSKEEQMLLECISLYDKRDDDNALEKLSKIPKTNSIVYYYSLFFIANIKFRKDHSNNDKELFEAFLNNYNYNKLQKFEGSAGHFIMAKYILGGFYYRDKNIGVAKKHKNDSKEMDSIVYEGFLVEELNSIYSKVFPGYEKL